MCTLCISLCLCREISSHHESMTYGFWMWLSDVWSACKIKRSFDTQSSRSANLHAAQDQLSKGHPLYFFQKIFLEMHLRDKLPWSSPIEGLLRLSRAPVAGASDLAWEASWTASALHVPEMNALRTGIGVGNAKASICFLNGWASGFACQYACRKRSQECSIQKGSSIACDIKRLNLHVKLIWPVRGRIKAIPDCKVMFAFLTEKPFSWEQSMSRLETWSKRAIALAFYIVPLQNVYACIACWSTGIAVHWV